MVIVGIIIIALVVVLVVTAFKYGEAIGEEIGFDEATRIYEEAMKEEQQCIR